MSNLNTFSWDYWPWRHLPNWPHNFKNFFKSFRRAFQRVTRGFCDEDTWDLDNYYRDLFIASLKEFDKNSYGTPNKFYKEFGDNGRKEWSQCINEIVRNFEMSREEMWEGLNEFEEEFHLLCPWEFEEDEDGNCVRKPAVDSRAHEISRLYFERDAEISKLRRAHLETALKMFSENFENFWD